MNEIEEYVKRELAPLISKCLKEFKSLKRYCPETIATEIERLEEEYEVHSKTEVLGSWILLFDKIGEIFSKLNDSNIFGAIILKFLEYDVKWIANVREPFPFDILAVKDGKLFLIDVKHAPGNVSDGFQSPWPGRAKYVCEQLNAEPLVLLITHDKNGFGITFLKPLFTDKTFIDTRPIKRKQALDKKINQLKNKLGNKYL